MMQRIEVPNIGVVEFPAEMSDAQIHAIIQKQYPELGKQEAAPQQQESQTWGSNLKDIGNAWAGTIQGAGGRIINTPSKLLNSVLPNNVQIPLIPEGEGLEAEGGKFLGDLATFGVGSGALNKLRQVSEAIPGIGQIAKALGGQGLSGVARRAIGTGAYGALENPEDRTSGAMTGAGLSAGIDALTGTVGKILPKKYMGQVYESVANGLKREKDISTEKFDKVLIPFGGQPVRLEGLNAKILKGEPKLKDAWSDYQQNPSILNAHRLQSQLAATDRRLKYGIDDQTNQKKNLLGENREKVVESIKKALGSKYPEAREAYTDAQKYYRENFIPYSMMNKAIRSITDPTPEKLARKIDMVTKREAYPKNKIDEIEHPIVPKEISSLGEELSNRIRNRNVAKTLGGIAAGSVVGRAVGAPLMGEILGGYFGSKSVDPLRKITAGQGEQAKQALSGMLQRIYGGMGGGNLPSDILKTAVLR